MKKLFAFILIAASMASCSHRIADLTQVSTRNMNAEIDYKELGRYIEGRDTELHSVLIFIGPLGTPDIEDAIDDAIQKVPGGEYMTNVVIREKTVFLLLFSLKSYKVEGDVWGIPIDSASALK